MLRVILVIVLSVLLLHCERTSAVEQPSAQGLLLQGNAPSQIVTAPGPIPDVPAWKSSDGAPHVIAFKPAVQPGTRDRGSVMLWFYLDHTLIPDGKTTQNLPILNCPGLLSLQLQHKVEAISLLFVLGAHRDEGSFLNVELPGLPGPGWYHLALSWDCEQGICDGYLNGIPLRAPGTRIKPWKAKPLPSLDLTVGPLRIADLRLADRMVTDAELRQAVGRLHWGNTAYLLGAADRGKLDLEPRKGRLLYQCAMSSPNDVAQWIGEGPMKLAFTDGWMQMSSTLPDGPDGHTVFWCPQQTPDNYLIQWEIKPLQADGLCIVFFSAKGVHGEDIFDPHLAKRNGVFTQYTHGDINSYHVSYYANTPFNPGRITSNLRKNSGFMLVTNGPPGIAAGSLDPHIVRVMKDGPRIVLTVDDRIIIDAIDDEKSNGPVLGAGRIGLRQMQWMHAAYRDFRIYEISPR